MRNLKTVILLIAVFAVAFLSCTKNKEENALPDSIKKMINQDGFCICFSAVNKYKWESRIIYHTSGPGRMICCGTPEFTPFYNEKGEPIHNLDWQQFFEEAELIKNIYTCEGKNMEHQ